MLIQALHHGGIDAAIPGSKFIECCRTHAMFPGKLWNRDASLGLFEIGYDLALTAL